MLRMITRLVLPALALALLSSCPDDPPPGPPLPLEIGIKNEAGELELVSDRDSMAVVLGANGLNMVVPSLRAEGIDPHGPDVEVVVTVGGIVMAADIEGSRVDMQETSDGPVLWDIRVPFQTELCCYVCEEGTIEARLTDSTGQVFESVVTVVLERGGCPDPTACCGDARVCPDPDLALVCE